MWSSFLAYGGVGGRGYYNSKLLLNTIRMRKKHIYIYIYIYYRYMVDVYSLPLSDCRGMRRAMRRAVTPFSASFITSV